MSTTWKGYPEYEDSNVDYLKEVPAHWTLPPLYSRFHVELGKMLSRDRITGDNLVPYLRNVDVQWDEINLDDLPEMDILPTELERYTVTSSDLLVCEGGEVGRAAIVPNLEESVGFQKALHRIRPVSSDSTRFMFYTMAWAAQKGIFEAGSNPNTITHLTGEMLRHYRFPRPPASEQASITDFLDRETAKIDDLIAEKERLLELLDEKRTALITRAVTKGLDPNVPMKGSGLDWLDEIPDHWDVRPNGSLFARRDERNYPDLPVLNVSIHTGVTVRTFSTEHVEQQSEDRSVYKRAVKGDLAFNKMRMWQGAVGTVPVDGLVSPDYTVATPLSGVRTRFFELLFRTSFYKTEIDRHSYGMVRDRNRLYWINFKQIKSIVPPEKEQLEIIRWVDKRRSEIEALANSVREAIDYLQEYRTALISAAVTGQIDVREAAA